MLLQLDIHNIALIDEVSIELDEGLNVLTGETGAGKSIIIDSINAVLGERVSKELIRTGTEKALVEAVFKIDNAKFADIFGEMGMEPEDDGILIMSREITQSGRNTCRINGKMVSVSMLKAVGERLIDLHGQHDNQSLLKIENHIDLLDSFGGNSVNTLKSKYAELLGQYRNIKSALRALSGDPGERERKKDLLKFQVDEIKKAKLKKGEEEELNRQRLLLANAEKIAGCLSTAYSLLSSGEQRGRPALDLINEALSQINSISKLEESYGEIYNRLQELAYQMEDIAAEIRNCAGGVEYDPQMLEEIEERLDLISRLKRKYGATVADIQKFCIDAETQLLELAGSEEKAALLTAEKAELEGRLYDTAARLSAERANAARLLETRVAEQLNDLEMKKARFKVDIQFDALRDETGERKFSHNGLDRVEFLMSANAGEPLKPLARIASGGEMSRIMLAIKTILADADQIPTLIFDEIDAGISGKTAQKVGEKMSYISRGHQVICVTHLAPIACAADSHYLIEKVADDKSTRTKVSRLKNGDVSREIARLLGGEIDSETSVKYAEEMLNNAKKLKSY